MDRLKGKVALVTGAGRLGNIGLAICEAFLREGARGVIGTDLRTDEAEEITGRIASQFGSGRFHLLQHDVTSAGDWQRVVAGVTDEFGALDVLVNNAGISVHGGIETTSLDDLRKVMAVNHDALFLGMKACAPELAAAIQRFPGGGAIVNNISMSSYMANANNLAYHVSKSAARMLTLCGAVEFGPKKIRVNSVHPGLTLTPLVKESFAEYVAAGLWQDEAAAEAAIAGMGPLGVSSQPEDTAHAFVYLASEEARFVTGASLCHDGGIGLRY
ncbi:MAG: SDR family oxidoreductase [Pseudomonadales bacterium]|nr:SDR family oxidoreductase [Pseudomonadales bacterium]MCP5202937.1 SDR family oxidoreductase [Pseudomonadales bacterium]